MSVSRNSAATASNPLAALLGQLTGKQPQADETTATTERPKSEFWLNVGVVTKNADGEDLFVQLPRGMAIDKLDKSPARRTEAGNQLAQAKNGLVDIIETIKASLEPGQEVEVPLTVRIYRVAGEAEAGEATVEGNPLLAGIVGAFNR